jgi:hypothetical protein
MLFCPGRGPPGNTSLSLFAEPANNKNFSERKSMFVSTKLEMIQISFLLPEALNNSRQPGQTPLPLPSSKVKGAELQLGNGETYCSWGQYFLGHIGSQTCRLCRKIEF